MLLRDKVKYYSVFVTNEPRFPGGTSSIIFFSACPGLSSSGRSCPMGHPESKLRQTACDYNTLGRCCRARLRGCEQTEKNLQVSEVNWLLPTLGSGEETPYSSPVG